MDGARSVPRTAAGASPSVRYAAARALRYSTAPASSAPAPAGSARPSGRSLPVCASCAAVTGRLTEALPSGWTWLEPWEPVGTVWFPE